jgi:hypothetical protein
MTQTTYPNTETVVENGVTIVRWLNGQVIRRSDCDACTGWAANGGPEHQANSTCRSGKRDHCSCDGCY